MKNPINLGTNTSTTQDWLMATKDMSLTIYDVSIVPAPELIEPDAAVNLPAAERARMNKAMPGVRAPK